MKFVYIFIFEFSPLFADPFHYSIILGLSLQGDFFVLNGENVLCRRMTVIDLATDVKHFTTRALRDETQGLAKAPFGVQARYHLAFILGR